MDLTIRCNDLPIDETTGVFISSDSPLTNNCGTRDAPCFDATTLLDQGHAFLFVRASDTVLSLPHLEESVIGGLDENWQMTETGRSRVERVCCELWNGPVYANLTSDASSLGMRGPGNVVLWRFDGRSGLEVQKPALAVDLDRNAIGFTIGASSLLRSGVGFVDVIGVGTQLLVQRTYISGTDVDSGGELDAASSIFDDVRCAGCRSVRLTHSTVMGGTTAMRLSDGSDLTLISSIVVSGSVDLSTGQSTALRMGDGVLTAVGTRFSARTADNLIGADGVEYGVDDLSAFLAADAAQRGDCGFFLNDPSVLGDGTLFAGDEAPPLLGVSLSTFDVPSGTAVDYFGSCRGDQGYAGADATWP
jgi:hypothetical protein